MGGRWHGVGQRTVIASVAVLTLLLSPAVHAVRTPPTTEAESARPRFEHLIERHIALYNAAFPDLQFVHLRGGLGWSLDMQFLPILLGHDAVSLDYEHPAVLREDLRLAAMRRLGIMLRGSHPSASLFRKGSNGLARRDNVCIITLDPDAVATTDLETTSEMLDLPRTVIERMHPARHLDVEDHLAFALDHEAFHCLDALYNGPIPRSHRPYAANYASFRNENGADAFAVAMNIKRHGRLTRYARNIMNIRALALVHDPDHCTWAIIGHVLELNPQTVAAAPVQKLFKVAGGIRDMLAPEYEQYVSYRLAAYEVKRQLDLKAMPAGRPSTALTSPLARQTEFWFRQLFTDEPFAVLRHKVSALW